MTQHQLKYTGPTQHTRTISVKEAKGAGFVLAEDLRWGLDNRHTVLVDDLDSTALDYFKGDSDFKVTEIEATAAEPEGQPAADTAEAQVAEESADGAAGDGDAAATTTRGRRSTSTTTATT